MFITVRQLAEKVNNKQRFAPEELRISWIDVYVTNNNRKIKYTVHNTNRTTETYTEGTVPHSIIYLINRKRPDLITEDEMRNKLYRYYI